MKKQKDFYKVNDVKEILSVSANTAYKIIRELNKEIWKFMNLIFL